MVDRAKYQPYDALRQRFWLQYLKQYDSDDTGTISHLELTSMLDSLGSTLSHQTINSFFTRFNKSPHDDVLTYAEAIQCLETEICRPTSEKRRLNPDEKGGIGVDTSVLGTPNVSTPGVGAGTGPGGELALNLDKLDFSGPAGNLRDPSERERDRDPMRKPEAPKAVGRSEGNQRPLPVQREVRANGSGGGNGIGEEQEEMMIAEEMNSETLLRPPSQSFPGLPVGAGLEASTSSSDAEEDWSGSGSGSGSNGDGSPSPDNFERVINVKNCPLCHRPRLNSKAERDIVTHLAVCASQDWARVDRIMVGNFVTASQAQRKWYTKIFSKMSSGDYRLGAVSVSFGLGAVGERWLADGGLFWFGEQNSANIIVQNRITGEKGKTTNRILITGLCLPSQGISLAVLNPNSIS